MNPCRKSALHHALIALSALLCAAAAQAHSGQVALAFHVAGIAVDGDLADWPADLPRYPVALAEYGDAPTDSLDYRGFFRVAYDSTAQALYAAIEVRDQSAVIDSSAAANWLSTDCGELYIHTDHDGEHALIAQYEMAGVRLQIGNPSHVDVQVRRRGDRQVYEWRLDAAAIFGGEQRLRPGRVLGMDPVVIDKDADGSHSWMAWSRGTRKFDNPGRLGDIVLMGEPEGLGALLVTAAWRDNGAAVQNAKVHIAAADGQGLQVTLETDAAGQARLDLPAGRYAVRPAARNAVEQPATVEIRPDGETRARLDLIPVLGERVAAGPGRRTAARPGVRVKAWHNFGPVDGLPYAATTALLQDRAGYLWVGTEGGLVRYDGQDFLLFTARDGLPDGPIRQLDEDDQGRLWIAAEEGLAHYDGRAFTRFGTDDGLPSAMANAVLAGDGGVWVGTPLGLSRYDGRWFTTLTTVDGLVDNNALSLARAKGGGLWIGGDGGFSRYQDGTFSNVQIGETINHIQGVVLSILEARDGSVWFATYEGVGVYRDGALTATKTGNGLRDWVTSLVEDGRGTVWIGTRNGLRRFDGTAFSDIGIADGLSHPDIRAIAVDRENSIWVGTEGGISRFDGRSFSYTPPDQSLAGKTVLSLLTDRQGRIWAGTSQGLHRYGAAGWVHVRSGAVWDDQPVRSVIEDRQGRIWVGAFNGLSHYDGRWHHFAVGGEPLDIDIHGLAADRRGRIWVASWEGICTFEDGQLVNHTTGRHYGAAEVARTVSPHGMIGGKALSVFEDSRGRIWADADGGVNLFDGERWTSYTFADGVGHDVVRAFFEDRQGRVWLGTASGIDVFENGRFRPLPLPTDMAQISSVLDFMEDAKGRVWIGTGNGLGVYDGQVMQVLLRRDGLADPIAHALMEDDRGRVWIGSGGSGVTVYEPQRGAPRLVLKDIVTNTRLGPVTRVELPSSQPLLAFEFLGLSFKTRDDALLYRYRLAGHDDRWRTTRSKRVEYRDLPRGAYTFEVQAVDRDLNYSRQNLRVAVEVHPPYRQMALYATLGLAGLLLVASVGRILRSRRELEQRVDERTAELAEATQEAESARDEAEVAQAEAESAREEAEVAQSEAESANQAKSMFLANMSHEIRTPLNAILGYAQVLQMRPSADPELKAALDAIDRGGLHLLDLINSVLDLSKIEAAHTEVESIHFDLGSLVHSLDALFRHQSQRKGLQWQVRWARGDQPLDGAPRAVGVFGDEGKLRQVLVNLLGNAVKFTRAGRVTLDLALPADGSEVYGFAIADTGPGIDRAAQRAIFEPFTQVKAEARVGGTGLGLALASRYVELMGGELAVASAPGQGARFSFELSLAGAEPVADTPPHVQARPDATGRLALIAEDGEASQDVMRRLLAGAGLDVIIAEDGETAVARALTDRPEIVFMDIWMPRLDGQTAARRIAQALGDDRPKLVAVTASALEHERQQYRADFDEVLLKPVRADQLYRTIERLLDLDLEHKEQASAPDDFAELVLPQALHSKLCEAVEDGLVTDLKGYLAEVHQLGPQGAALAERLGALSRRFANDDILRILDQVKTREDLQ